MMFYIKNSLLLLFCVSALWLNAQETSISGNVSTAQEVPLANVAVTIKNGNFTAMTVTDAAGNYSFENLSETENIIFELEMENNNHPLNGVSTLDFVLGARHILGIAPFETADKYLAMDINNSGTITAFDLVQLKLLILGKTTEFLNGDTWRFVEKTALLALNFSQANNPEYDSILTPTRNLTAGESTVIDIIGIKVGDANGSAETN